MIIRNGIKYACMLCIRGHRAASCNHTDRPLVEIKRKGRPSTACFHCKELRMVRNANPSGSCQCRKENALNKCGCTNGEPCKCHVSRKKRQSQTSSTKGFSPVSDPAIELKIDQELSSLFNQPLSEILDINIPGYLKSEPFININSPMDDSSPYLTDLNLVKSDDANKNSILKSEPTPLSENNEVQNDQYVLHDEISPINYSDFDFIPADLLVPKKPPTN